MDITKLSTALSQQNVQQTAAVQVQKLAMDTAETQAKGLVSMMSVSAQDPMLGNNINVLR